MAQDVAQHMDLGKLKSDLRVYADIAGTRFDGPGIDRVIASLPEEWEDVSAMVRTTTEPPATRDVSVRLGSRIPVSPVARLRQAGLLRFEGHPLESLLGELVDRFPMWWGVDASVGRGTPDKVWAILEEPIPLDDMFDLPSLPASVLAARDHFDRAGIDQIGLFGLNFTKRSLNVYSPILAPGTMTAGRAVDIITGVGFAQPSDEEIERNAGAFNVYQTFSWDALGVQRLCFPMRYRAEDFPTHFHPVLEDFVSKAPFATDRRGFMFSNTYSAHGQYFKVQADYLGIFSDHFKPQPVR